MIRGLNKLKVDSLELKVSFKLKVDSKICVFCEKIKTKRITNHDNKKCRIANRHNGDRKSDTTEGGKLSRMIHEWLAHPIVMFHDVTWARQSKQASSALALRNVANIKFRCPLQIARKQIYHLHLSIRREMPCNHQKINGKLMVNS